MKGSFTLTQTDLDGAKTVWSYGPFEIDDYEALQTIRREVAAQVRWSPPKWWQWWRWNDQPRRV